MNQVGYYDIPMFYVVSQDWPYASLIVPYAFSYSQPQNHQSSADAY